MADFWTWWHEIPYHMNPVLVQIGGLKIHYYGVMYLVAALVVFSLLSYRIKTEKNTPIRNTNQLADIMLVVLIGMLIGARLGDVFFYNFSYFIQHPLEIFLPIRKIRGAYAFVGFSGMSYHGGVIGVAVAAWLYARKKKISLVALADFAAPAIPLAYMFGRIGNFINGELYGRVTTANIGTYFPLSAEHVLRHPSQLYEAFGEGLLLFLILWPLRKKNLPTGSLAAIYLFGYGFVRFIIEFFREPETYTLRIPTGQFLCVCMMAVGILFWVWARRQNR